MASKPWQDIITEIRYDRGILLGSERYKEMTGVEQSNALDSIDKALDVAQKWLDYYSAERDRNQGGFLAFLKIRKIRSMTDEELGGL